MRSANGAEESGNDRRQIRDSLLKVRHGKGGVR